MTTPTLRGTSSSVQTATTTHTTSLPVTANAGDYVVVLFTVHDDSTVSDFGGLTSAGDAIVTTLGRSYLLYGRLAASQTTISFTTAVSDTSVTLIYQYDPNANLVGFDSATRNNSSPDPPIPTIGIGACDEFAACTWLGNISLSTYPTGYSTSQVTDRRSAGVPYIGSGAAIKVVTSTEDPGVFALSASADWLAISWQVEYLLYSPPITAGTGSFTLTGNAVSLSRGQRISIDAGAFALTGIAATLARGLRLSADSGEFAVTGNDATLVRGRNIIADSGSVGLTGNAVDLVRGLKISADTSSFVLAGIAATLARGLQLSAGAASFTLTGNAVSLSRTRALAAESAHFALSGVGVEFGATGVLLASGGVFAIIGEVTEVIRTPPAMNAAPMEFIVDGGSSVGSRLLVAGGAAFITSSSPVDITPPPTPRWFGPTACACDCCVLPHVNVEIVFTTVEWQVSGADSATLTYKCNSDTETVVPITLTAGAATGTLPLGTGACWYRIDAENECGPVYEVARNYVLPICDCLHFDNETPDKWGSIPPVLVTISGTTAASGYGFCVGSNFCPTIGFSAAMYCGGPSIKVFRKTQATGCANYHTFIQIALYREGLEGLSRGVGITVVYESFWYRKRGNFATTNHYPVLTEILPADPYFYTSVPWQGETEFGEGTANNSWYGSILSRAFIGSVEVMKCPQGLLSTALEIETTNCRDRNNGANITCPPLTCIPDLTVSMTYG